MLSLLITVALGQQALASLLYPFGDSAGDSLLPPGDDLVSEEQNLYQEFKFYGETYDNIYVSSDGVVSFFGPVSQPHPLKFPLYAGYYFDRIDNETVYVRSSTIIAVFWNDHLPNHADPGNKVFYRQTTDPAVLRQASREIRSYFECVDDFTATWAYVATWYKVQPYLSRTENCDDGYKECFMNYVNTFDGCIYDCEYMYYDLCHYEYCSLYYGYFLTCVDEERVSCDIDDDACLQAAQEKCWAYYDSHDPYICWEPCVWGPLCNYCYDSLREYKQNCEHSQECLENGEAANLEHNTYQLVLVSDGRKSFAFLNYETVEWTELQWSLVEMPGENFTGQLTGTQVGFNHGDIIRSFTHPLALTPDVVNLAVTSNVGVPGRHVYRIDRDYVREGTCSPEVCLCEYGRDEDGDGKAELVKYNGDINEIGLSRGATTKTFTMSKRDQQSDPCRYKLKAKAERNDDGKIVLGNIELSVGQHPSGRRNKYAEKLKITGPDIPQFTSYIGTVWHQTAFIEYVSYSKFGVYLRPWVRYTGDDRFGFEHETLRIFSGKGCNWELLYRVNFDYIEEVVFSPGVNAGSLTGKCGECA